MYYEYNSEYEYCGDDFFDFEFVEPIKLSDINYMDIETVNGNLYYDTKNISDIKNIGFSVNDGYLNINNIECFPIDCNDDGYIIGVANPKIIGKNIEDIKISLVFDNAKVKFIK